MNGTALTLDSGRQHRAHSNGAGAHTSHNKYDVFI